MAHLCIFDDVAGGHHVWYLSGIVREVVRRGIDCTVACPHLDSRLAEDPHVAWKQVAPGTLRKPIGGYRTLKRLSKSWGSPDVFWDLYLDKNVWVLPRDLQSATVGIHVLHAVNQYQPANRDNLAKARTAILRNKITNLVRRGAVVVVHTRRALDVLSEFLPVEGLVQVGYPIDTPEPLAGRHDHDDPRVLFVGGARREKGLFELLDAMELVAVHTTLEVVGPQPEGVRDRATYQHPALDIRWTDRFVTNEELRAAHHRCDLVAAPYLPVFQARGGASGVLLQALAEGVGLLTTQSLADQLPEGYGGAVVASTHHPRALAKALEAAINNLNRLSSAAAKDGPAFTRSHHSFSEYVERLLMAG